MHDIDNYKVCLYGNNDRIGIIALEKSILNRYKVVKGVDISSELPSKNCMINDSLILGDNMNSIIYGEDESNELYKVTFIYRDGTKDEVTQDTFIKKDNYFMVLQSNYKLLRQIKLYNKENVDITNKYNNK